MNSLTYISRELYIFLIKIWLCRSYPRHCVMCGYTLRYVVYRVQHYRSALNHTEHAQSVKREQYHVHIISLFVLFFSCLSFDFSLSFMHSLGLVIQKKTEKEEEIGAHTMVIAFIHHSWDVLYVVTATSTHIARIQINLFKFFIASNYMMRKTTPTTQLNIMRPGRIMATISFDNINTQQQPRQWQRRRQLGALMLSSNDSSTPITALEISCHKRIERWHDKRNKNI